MLLYLIFMFTVSGWGMAIGTEFSDTICCTTGTGKVCSNGKSTLTATEKHSTDRK
jgi:hypothetical protein